MNKLGKLFLVVLLAVFITSTFAQADISENKMKKRLQKLKERVFDYVQLVKKQDYDKMVDYVNPKLKKEFKKYVTAIKQAENVFPRDITNVEVSKMSVYEDGKTAVVEVKITILDKQKNKTKIVDKMSTWIYKSGKWYVSPDEVNN